MIYVDIRSGKDPYIDPLFTEPAVEFCYSSKDTVSPVYVNTITCVGGCHHGCDAV
mgnify:CR=1 FL=1